MSETEGETPAAEGTHAAAAPVNAVCIATHGTLSPFYPASEDWTTYIERVNFYHVIAGAKKRSIFLANCATATYTGPKLEFPICPLCRIIVVDASSIFPLCVLHIS